MKKVHLLLALSTLLVIGCRHSDHRDYDHHSPNPTPTLKMIFSGTYMLVRTESQPDKIFVISPRDPKGLHQFHSNELLGDGRSQNVHITVEAKGLKTARDWSIDPFFPKDFIAQADVWKRPLKGAANDYLVTVELPLPDKVTFVSPLNPVTFENGMQSHIASNFILEYRVTELGKIHATSDELGNLRPLPSSALQKQFETLCQRPEIREEYYESCANMRNLLDQCAGAQTSVFFFGVGIPLGTQLGMAKEEIAVHAAEFFNLMLQSFQGLTVKPLLVPGKQDDQRGPNGSRPMLMETSFRRAAPRPRLLPVNAFTAVIDCKAGNLIVTAKTTQ